MSETIRIFIFSCKNKGECYQSLLSFKPSLDPHPGLLQFIGITNASKVAVDPWQHSTMQGSWMTALFVEFWDCLTNEPCL